MDAAGDPMQHGEYDNTSMLLCRNRVPLRKHRRRNVEVRVRDDPLALGDVVDACPPGPDGPREGHQGLAIPSVKACTRIRHPLKLVSVLLSGVRLVCIRVAGNVLAIALVKGHPAVAAPLFVCIKNRAPVVEELIVNAFRVSDVGSTIAFFP